MNRIAFIFLLLLSSAAMAEASNCNELNEKTKDLGWHRPYIAEVTGSGRLYFFTAPSAQCENKSLFIVPTDQVVIYSEYKGYSQISFSGKTEDYSTWVRSERLKIIAKPDEPFVPSQETPPN